MQPRVASTAAVDSGRRATSGGGEAHVRFAAVSMFRTPQVILFSENLPRAVAFYSSLGFTETFRVPTEGEPIHVDLTLDGYKIGIASVASTRDDHGLDPVPEGQRAAVILWTDDTAAAFAKLTANGAPGLVAPREWLGRLLIAWIADPDGNPIQIVQHL
jgi:glyoxylase I family protein